MSSGLVIGGARDGDWLTQDRDYFTSALYPGLPKLPSPGVMDKPIEVKQEHYNLQRYMAKDKSGVPKEFCLWVKEGLSPADAMQKLFDGYRPSRRR